MQPNTCLLGTEHEQWWAQSLPQLKSSQSKLSGKPSCLHSSAMLQKCQNKFFWFFLWYEVISKSMILNLLPFRSTLIWVSLQFVTFKPLLGLEKPCARATFQWPLVTLSVATRDKWQTCSHLFHSDVWLELTWLHIASCDKQSFLFWLQQELKKC